MISSRSFLGDIFQKIKEAIGYLFFSNYANSELCESQSHLFFDCVDMTDESFVFLEFGGNAAARM